MKKPIVVFIIYAITITITLALISMGPWPVNPFIFAIIGILAHVGLVIQNEQVKKEYIIYAGIFSFLVTAYFVIAAILDMGYLVTWLDVIANGLILLTVVIMLFRISKALKDADSKHKSKMRFIAYFAALSSILSFVAMLMDWILTT